MKTEVYNKRKKRKSGKKHNTRRVVWRWKNGDVRLVTRKSNMKKR